MRARRLAAAASRLSMRQEGWDHPGWTSRSDSLCVSLSGRWNHPEHLLCTPLCSVRIPPLHTEGVGELLRGYSWARFVVIHGHAVAP